MLSGARSFMKQPAILFGEDFGKVNKRMPITLSLILKVILYVWSIYLYFFDYKFPEPIRTLMV